MQRFKSLFRVKREVIHETHSRNHKKQTIQWEHKTIAQASKRSGLIDGKEEVVWRVSLYYNLIYYLELLRDPRSPPPPPLLLRLWLLLSSSLAGTSLLSSSESVEYSWIFLPDLYYKYPVLKFESETQNSSWFSCSEFSALLSPVASVSSTFWSKVLRSQIALSESPFKWPVLFPAQPLRRIPWFVALTG